VRSRSTAIVAGSTALDGALLPQQNGVVEHHNQTIVGTTRSMMKAVGMPGAFWGEAVMTVVYLLNRSLT
jgi:hypothetical protein